MNSCYRLWNCVQGYQCVIFKIKFRARNSSAFTKLPRSSNKIRIEHSTTTIYIPWYMGNAQLILLLWDYNVVAPYPTYDHNGSHRSAIAPIVLICRQDQSDRPVSFTYVHTADKCWLLGDAWRRRMAIGYHYPLCEYHFWPPVGRTAVPAIIDNIQQRYFPFYPTSENHSRTSSSGDVMTISKLM